MTIHYNGFTFSEIHALGFNITEVYHGADLVWGAWKNILYNVSGDYSTYLPRGYYYQIKIHGAGGAGGTSGDVGSYGGAAGLVVLVAQERYHKPQLSRTIETL